MYSRTLDEIRRKFVQLLRCDPPARAVPGPPLATGFDRWVMARFSREEIAFLCRLEHQYGETAMSEWFAEVLLEAGIRGRVAA